MASTTIQNLAKVLESKGVNAEKPIFGICLGNQLLGLAAGASTYKLPFGNRGQNQPVLNMLTGQCFITPQNHGYALNAHELPEGWAPLFTNRNDDSNEGIMHTEKPWFTAQFHPEAWGGPTDTEFLFDAFLDMMVEKKSVDLLTSYQQGLSTPTKHAGKVSVVTAGAILYFSLSCTFYGHLACPVPGTKLPAVQTQCPVNTKRSGAIKLTLHCVL
eukprot:SAG31_NODE_50_length_30520_cov_89.906712_9_plen_215_part_00